LTLGEIVTALEGPVVPHEFVHGPATDDDGAGWLAACAVRNAWLAATEASQRVLDQTTIADLLEQQVQIRAHRAQRAQQQAASGMLSARPALLNTEH